MHITNLLAIIAYFRRHYGKKKQKNKKNNQKPTKMNFIN